ncbi:MAG: hypothetical protein HFH62_01405 [Lachnospiraceae bacterium]|nr:hypothetical protein [Lachnospiraceae bacterium]
MRYFLSIIGVVACFLLLCVCTDQSLMVQMGRMLDLVTLFSLLLVIITVMISAGLHKDFFHAFRLALSKRGNWSLLELKRAKEAIDLALKAIVGGGVLNFSVGAVESFFVDRLKSIPPCLGVSTLGILYAVFMFLLLIPIQAKLKVKMMEYMGE